MPKDAVYYKRDNHKQKEVQSKTFLRRPETGPQLMTEKNG